MSSASGQEGFAPPSADQQAGGYDSAANAAELDEAQLKKIFQHFDTDGSGSIDADELREAMGAMGIKVTIANAKKVLKTIDEDQNGTVEWDEFQKFFEKCKNPEEMRSLLSAQNAKYLDYKMMVEGDPNFGKRFFVPPSKGKKFKFSGHEDNVEAVAWIDSKSEFFVTGSIDGSLRVWDSTTGKLAHKLVEDIPGGVYCVNVMNEGARCLAGLGGTKDNIGMFDMAKRGADARTMTYVGPPAPVYAVCAEKIKNPAYFLAGAKNGHMAWYDMTRAEPTISMTDFHEGVVYSVDLNKEGNMMISTSQDGMLQIADFRGGLEWKIHSSVEEAAASGICFKALFRGDREFLTCGDDYCVKKWDMRKLKHGPVENFLGVTSPIRQICMSPCEKYLLSASHDGAIRMWVIDEREYIDADIETCRRTIDKLEKKRAQFDDKLAEGDDVDENEVKECVSELERAYARGITVSSAEQERYAMNCVQARMGLDGHTLPVTSIAWRDDPADPSRVQILSGSQDQSALLFDIKKPNPKNYTKWGTGGGDDSPARKGGYGG
eukprot:CAMPEP_0178990618 /NCGR_PEP_ID=MMETSP0795-20121207/5060_1 /TAXON_ID=88552 /ORGANISM="Amoebophrya sp., Strain Ameob2" /LENGTH=548 /DNA_ID=CAMNT_0020682211 /DNA_START=265 /DNA_END=1911 /DNA_ORIENTATION=+